MRKSNTYIWNVPPLMIILQLLWIVHDVVGCVHALAIFSIFMCEWWNYIQQKSHITPAREHTIPFLFSDFVWRFWCLNRPKTQGSFLITLSLSHCVWWCLSATNLSVTAIAAAAIITIYMPKTITVNSPIRNLHKGPHTQHIRGEYMSSNSH